MFSWIRKLFVGKRQLDLQEFDEAVARKEAEARAYLLDRLRDVPLTDAEIAEFEHEWDGKETR